MTTELTDKTWIVLDRDRRVYITEDQADKIKQIILDPRKKQAVSHVEVDGTLLPIANVTVMSAIMLKESDDAQHKLRGHYWCWICDDWHLNADQCPGPKRKE